MESDMEDATENTNNDFECVAKVTGKRKCYTLKMKLEACEFAEKTSNERAAKHFQVP
jgi:hypothetical protein